MLPEPLIPRLSGREIGSTLLCTSNRRVYVADHNFALRVKYFFSYFWLLCLQAAGLGHVGVIKAILSACPEAVNMTDREGRTPLHYAAAAKGSGAVYDLLLEHGADETAFDKVRTRTRELSSSESTCQNRL